MTARHQAPRPVSSAPVNPLAGLPPQQVYDTAGRLSRERRFTESLPYYRSALARVRTDFMEIHRDFATALYSASFELKLGPRGVPLTRSSLERVSLLREALRHMAIAERFQMTPAKRAALLKKYGEILQSYGFPWEAMLQYGRAAFADPTEREQTARARAFTNLMEHPERYSLESVPVQP